VHQNLEFLVEIHTVDEVLAFDCVLLSLTVDELDEVGPGHDRVEHYLKVHQRVGIRLFLQIYQATGLPPRDLHTVVEGDRSHNGIPRDYCPEGGPMRCLLHAVVYVRVAVLGQHENNVLDWIHEEPGNSYLAKLGSLPNAIFYVLHAERHDN